MSKISYTPGDPIPESLGAVADQMKKVKDLRIAMQKEVDEVEKREKELRDHLINEMDADSEGAVGKRYVAAIKTEEVPIVEDWDDFNDYMLDEDRVDLLQKRLSVKAIKELLDDGVKVPGINTMIVKKVSLTKR